MSPERKALALRLGLLAVLLAVLGGMGLRALRRVQVQQEIEATCALEDRAEHLAAVERSEPLLDRLGAGQAALLAGCRCHALVELGRGAECLPLVQQIQPEDEPSRATALAAIVVALQADDYEEAGRWAALLARDFPPSRESLNAEVAVRLRAGSAAEVARDLEGRIRALPPAETRGLRLSLADRLAKDGEVDAALAMLEPPDESDLAAWFGTRNRILGLAGRQFDLVKSFERWQSMGGDPRRLQLEYALVMETSGLQDGSRDPVTLYRDGIAAADPVRDLDLIQAAYSRLIGIFMISGEPDRALEVFLEARAKGVEVSFTPEELERLATDGGAAEGLGQLTFEFPAYQPGDRLAVAPADAEPADAAYALFALEGRPISVQRRSGDTPVRWVWSDAAGRPLASGVSWPDAGRPLQLEVGERPAPPPAPPPYQRAVAAADGRNSVYVLVLDCADWRLIRHLQARGEMPVLSALEALGTAGVLTSVPAMTGTAMEKLVHPRSEATFTLLGYLHHMGAELGGLSSVGSNPLDAMTWVLKEYPYIFDVVAQADRSAANMLFSHGGKVDVGRNAEVSGPGEVRRTLTGLTWQRALRPEELAAYPGLREPPEYVLDIAAEMDAGVKLIGNRDLDLLLLRIEPLDIMTHAHYGETTRPGRDDARSVLYETYRYLDRRLGELANAVDADDTLIVMSDHGIQATMLHDPEAMFIAVGPRVPVGRLDGKPEIAGVARLLLDLLGVPVPEGWPDTGLSKILR